MAVRVQFTVSYTDTLTEGGKGESGSTCTVHDSYCVLHGYSDRGGVGGESGSTCTVHVLPQLLCLTRIL